MLGAVAAVLTRKAKAAGGVPVPQGVTGRTYFKAGDGHWPAHQRLFLDGVDVTNHATECDLVGGWVVLLDHDANGKRVVPIRARVRRGDLHTAYVRHGIVRGLTA